jgi:hypothetical protein
MVIDWLLVAKGAVAIQVCLISRWRGFRSEISSRVTAPYWRGTLYNELHTLVSLVSSLVLERSQPTRTKSVRHHQDNHKYIHFDYDKCRVRQKILRSDCIIPAIMAEISQLFRQQNAWTSGWPRLKKIECRSDWPKLKHLVSCIIFYQFLLLRVWSN